MAIIELTPSIKDDPLTGELGFIRNPDGSISTERSITIESEGRFFNLPTLVEGQLNPKSIARGDELTPEQRQIAIDRFKQRGGFGLGGFSSENEAVQAAVARSNEGGSTSKFSQKSPGKRIIELTASTPDVTEQDVPLETIDELPAQPGFFERFGEDIEKRRAETVEIFEAAGEQNIARTAVQLAGKTFAGTALDFIGEGLVSAFRALPDDIEIPIREQAVKVLETDLGQQGIKLLSEGQEAFAEFAKTNPNTARDIEALVNIGFLFAPVKGKAASKETTIAGKAAERVGAAAEKQAVEKQAKFLQDLVSPKQTPKVLEEQALRTTESGILKTQTVAPSRAEAQMMEEVAKIPGVNPSKSVQGNLNVIKQANREEAIFLERALKKNEIIFPKKEINAALDRTLAELMELPVLAGDAGTAALRVMNKMKRLIAEGKSTGSGLLKARKRLDRWIERIPQGAKALESETQTAMGIAVKEIRQTVNNFLASKAKDVPIKKSLKKQSTLFRTIDNMAPKAAAAGKDVVERLSQTVTKIIPIPSKIMSGIAAASLVTAGAAGLFFNPALVGGTLAATGVGLGAKAAVTSVAAKKSLQQLLKFTDKAIIAAKNTPQTLRELRADRVALLEVIEGLGNE